MVDWLYAPKNSFHMAYLQQTSFSTVTQNKMQKLYVERVMFIPDVEIDLWELV